MVRRVRFALTVMVCTEVKCVRELVGHCTCPVQFPMIKVGEGKYQIGDSRSLIFVRVLRNHVMVRVGGGWDTLENYLNKHDPCRCHFKGHRGGSGAVSAARHQIIRRSSTSSIIATRIHPSSPSPHPPTTPTTPRKTPSMASMASPSPAAAAAGAAASSPTYPGAGGLRGSHSEHTSFIKGPSPSRGVLPASHSFHKALSPARSSSPGPEGLLSPGRTSTSATTTTTPAPASTSHSSQGLVGILKTPPARSVSPEFEGVRRLPTSASSQSFRESRELAGGGGSRESSVGRSLDSVRLSSSSSTTSTSRPSSPGFCSSSLRQGEDPRLRASQLPQYQRCKSPSPGRVLGVEEIRCVSPAVSGGRSLLPRPVGCGGGSGSGIPRPVSPVSGSGVGTAAGRRPASSLSKSVSFDTPARTEVDPDSWPPTADTDVVVQSTTLDHRQGEGDAEVTSQLDQINTMTLSEFRKLINNHLSPQTSEVTEVSTARPVGSCQDEADGGPLKRSQSADPQTSSWHLVRDKARSMCSSFASRLSGKKPSSSGVGGPSPSILARRTPPKSPSTGSRSSSSSTPAERPKTPSTVAGEQAKIPVLANRPKTPTSSSNAHRPKTPTAGARSEDREPSRPQTPSRSKTPTAVNNHSKQPSSKAGSRNPLTRANSANAAYSVTTVVDSKAYASFTCTNSPSSPRKNIAGTSSDSMASDVCVKNSSYIHTSMQSADFGHTCVTGISLQTQFYLSSSDDESNDHGDGSDMVEEGGDKKQTASVSVGGNGTPRSSRIPKPSFIPRATTPGPADAQPASTGKVNGSHGAPGGRSRISPLTGRSSLERELSADSGDGGREATTPQKRSQTPDLSSARLNRVRRAHTPGPEHNSYPSSPVVRTPRSTTPGPEHNSYSGSPVVKNPRSTTPGPDSSSHKSKAKPNPVTLRGGSRKSAMDKKSIRRSRSLTDLIQAVEDISKDIQKNIPNKQQSSVSTPRTTSTNSRPKLQRQKSCEADAEVLMISRNPQGQHSVYLPEQQRRGVFASPGPRKRLQPSASLDADKVRSRTPGPHMGLRGILRKPSQPAQNESDVHSMVFNRTDAWVDSTLHDPKRKHSTTHLRRPMTPNSLSIAESELLSRPLEEIQAALPSPSKVPPVADPEDLDVPPEDPEMYKKMEMLFEKYREMELRASVRHTPGGSQDNISGTTSESPGSHLSSGGQGQGIQNSSTSSHSSSSVKPSVAMNPVSFSSGMSSVHSYDTDSSRAVSVEGRLSRDSSPSRTTSSAFHTHDSASNSGGFSDPNVVLDDDESGASSVTPRPHHQPATPTPLDSLTDVDAETIARNPSALVSKIKEILQIRPRRDNKTNTRTRIPAPTALTPRKHPEVLSPRATGPESGLSPTLHEPVPNGYDVSRDESSNSDFSSDISSRPDTPPVGKASKAGSLLSRARVRLFDKKQSVKNGGGQGSVPATPGSNSASPIVTPRQRWEEDDEEFV